MAVTMTSGCREVGLSVQTARQREPLGAFGAARHVLQAAPCNELEEDGAKDGQG